MFNAVGSRECRLKMLHVGTPDESRIPDDIRDRGVYLGLDREVLRVEVGKRNGYRMNFMHGGLRPQMQKVQHDAA